MPIDDSVERKLDHFGEWCKKFEKMLSVLEKNHAEVYSESASKFAALEGIKGSEGKLKSLSARVEALSSVSKEVENLKKDSASMTDLGALKRLVSDLAKRVDALEKKK